MSRRWEVVGFCAMLAITLTTGRSEPLLGKAPAAALGPAAPSPADLGIEFVANSPSSLIVERGGKRYLVELVSRTIRETGDPTPGGAGQSGAAPEKGAA